MGYWAVDRAEVGVLSDEALKFTSTERDGMRWFALIDEAFNHQGTPLTWPHTRWPLYCQGRLTALGDVSPTLLELPLRDDLERRAELGRLIGHTSGRPMLSLLASRLSGEHLREHWQAFLEILDPDNEPLLARWGDTRCSPSLLATLTAEQRASLKAPIEQWRVLSRHATWQTLLSDPAATDQLTSSDPALGQPLRFTIQQIDRLLHDGEADAVIDCIYRQMPGLLPDRWGTSVYVHVRSACDVARNSQITAYPEIVAVAVAALLTQGNILNDPRLQAALKPTTSGSSSIHDRLAELMPDA